MAKSKYTYRCFKCSRETGLDIVPSAQPWCWNEEGHHHNRGLVMLYVSRAKEPEYKHKTMPSDIKEAEKWR